MFEAIPSPGADSIISSFCGAVSGRLAEAPTHARRACRSAPRPSGERRRELFATTVAALPVRDLGALRARIQPFQAVAAPIAGFRARRLCRQASRSAMPATETPQFQRPTTLARLRQARRGLDMAEAAGRASTELDTRPSRSGRRRLNKSRTISQSCQEIVGFLEAGRTDAGSTARRSSTAALSVSAAAPPRDGKSSIWLLMRRSVILP